MKRREFVKACAIASYVIPVAMIVQGKSLHAAAEEVFGDDKLVKADADPVAKALKYRPDASTSAERKDARQGVAAKAQSCTSCALYAKTGKLKSGDEVGKCTMIQSGLVMGKGWCTSWSKKA